MATGPLLLLLIAAVPGLAGRIEATVHVRPSVDVAAVAQSPVVEVSQTERAPQAATAATKVRFLVKKAPVPVIVVAAPVTPPLDEPLPRRAVWRSPAPPQGPPSRAG